MSVSNNRSGQSKERNEENLDMKTLFVRSIPDDVNDETLANFFSNFAPIKHAVIVKNDKGASRGFGFVSFADQEDTKAALSQARKTKLSGQLLRVDIAKRRDRSKKGDVADNTVAKAMHEDTAKDDNSLLRGKPKLIIRNMPWSFRDPEKLKKVFGIYGTVVEAKIPRKHDGKLCGFAFVTMKKMSNCQKAIEGSKNLKIDGRPVAVDFAVQKSKWEDYTSSEKKEASMDDKKSEGLAEESGEEDIGSSSESDSEEEKGEEEEEEEEEEEDTKENKPPVRDFNSDKRAQARNQYSVFIRNVPYDATEESLSEHFSKFGPVKYALPVIDKETGLAKGTAFVAFKDEKTYNFCVDNAPAAGATSLLIGDDVLPEYVYEGRILSVTPTLERDQANRMAEKNASKRKELLGKAPGERDRRNLYLLNEGRVVEGSQLASLLSKKDMEIREKSYKLRVDQLKRNPALHLSLTRLAIRNLPRAMTEKSLKALARKAVVQFATEVNNGERHPLSKEEIIRSTKEKYKFMSPEDIEKQKKKDKKQGLVKQAKIIMEVKGSTVGRSRGYGFVEYKDHKSALMGLRWMNVHMVTKDEVLEGLTEEEKKNIDVEGLKGRSLCVEFAIENANVVKRRRENIQKSKENYKRKLETSEEPEKDIKKSKTADEQEPENNGMNNDIKRLIGYKRRRKNAKK